jgi:hypothetical protein
VISGLGNGIRNRPFGGEAVAVSPYPIGTFALQTVAAPTTVASSIAVKKTAISISPIAHVAMIRIGSIGSRIEFPTNHTVFPLRGTQAITKPMPMNVSVIPIRSCDNSDIFASFQRFKEP